MLKKIRFNSPVILYFMIICIVALVASVLTDGITNKLLFSVYRSGLTNPLSYIRMIGHVMGHADFNHFLGNMSYILLLGPMLEEKYGKWVLIDVILLTAIVSGLIHVILFPTTMLLGASGVVFAFIMLSSFASMKEGTIPLTFLIVAMFYIGQEVYSAMFIADSVSNLTHIIGGIVGSALGYKIGKSKQE